MIQLYFWKNTFFHPIFKRTSQSLWTWSTMCLQLRVAPSLPLCTALLDNSVHQQNTWKWKVFFSKHADMIVSPSVPELQLWDTRHLMDREETFQIHDMDSLLNIVMIVRERFGDLARSVVSSWGSPPGTRLWEQWHHQYGVKLRGSWQSFGHLFLFRSVMTTQSPGKW